MTLFALMDTGCEALLKGGKLLKSYGGSHGYSSRCRPEIVQKRAPYRGFRIPYEAAAMISSASRSIVRPTFGAVRKQVKNVPAVGRHASTTTTRRSALKLCVAMAASPIIEAYVKGVVFDALTTTQRITMIRHCVITIQMVPASLVLSSA